MDKRFSPFLSIIHITLLLKSSDASCELLTRGLVTCYNVINVPLPQTDIRSILELPLAYLPNCGRPQQYQFLECYREVLDKCTDFRQINPLMFDYISMKSFLYGMCDNKEEYIQSIECLEREGKDLHMYVTSCFDSFNLFEISVEATNTGNWTAFCSLIPDQIKCLEVVLNALQCEETLFDISTGFIHAMQPSACRHERGQYHWITTYGLNDAHGLETEAHKWISVVFSVLCYLFFC